MEKQNLIELTNKLYKLTLLFPKREPLRYKIREVADEILANSVSSPKKIEKNLKILKNYFEVAKFQNWVSYFDILALERAYDKINPRELSSKPEELSSSARSSARSSDARKEKILGILKEREKVQVGQVNEILNNVSKRTLRRDFDQLLKQGLVKRLGQKNETYYVLANNKELSSKPEELSSSKGA